MRPNASRDESPTPRSRDLLALGLVIAAAIGVAVTSVFMIVRTEGIRTEITDETEALRALSDSLALAVTEQAMNLQVFVLDGDAVHLEEYRRARERSEPLVDRLGAAARDFGPIASRTSDRARAVLQDWHRTHDRILGSGAPLPEPGRHLEEHETRVLDLLAVLSDLSSVVHLRSIERRASIRRVYWLGAVLTALMGLAAVVAAFFAYRTRKDLHVRGVEARQRAREAERALRDRQEILGIVSHDLRNALSAISGSLSLVREVDLPPDRLQLQLDVAARATANMSRLISDLLDSASIEAGRLSVERRPLAVLPTVEDAVRAWEAEARSKGVELLCGAPPAEVSVEADSERIVQVLGNLIGNAIKFTPEGGRVEVAARVMDAGDGRVRFSVEDTGPGIPDDHLPRIFDRFYQVKASGRAGAGLGLSIARGIVEAHGSELEVETRPGFGTRFWFELPALAPRRVAASEPPADLRRDGRPAGDRPAPAPPETPARPPRASGTEPIQDTP